jgi:hypothetical protein
MYIYFNFHAGRDGSTIMYTLVKEAYQGRYIMERPEDRQSQQSPSNGGFIRLRRQ